MTYLCMRRVRRTGRLAFTLIELMVVLIILAVLAVAIVPNVVGKGDAAKKVKAKADIAIIESFLDQFYLNMGRYPTSEEGLRVLHYPPEEDQDKWGGPYSKKPISKDPWGNGYVYECPATRSTLPYDLFSMGKDGKEGGEDLDADITCWAESVEDADAE